MRDSARTRIAVGTALALFLLGCPRNSKVVIDFSLVGGFDHRSSNLYVSDPDNMLGVDPGFVNADDLAGTEDDDLSLDPSSPAIGAGEFGADMGAG